MESEQGCLCQPGTCPSPWRSTCCLVLAARGTYHLLNLDEAELRVASPKYYFNTLHHAARLYVLGVGVTQHQIDSIRKNLVV